MEAILLLYRQLNRASNNSHTCLPRKVWKLPTDCPSFLASETNVCCYKRVWPTIKVRKFILYVDLFYIISCGVVWCSPLVATMIHDRCPQLFITLTVFTSLVTQSVTGYTTANTVLYSYNQWCIISYLGENISFYGSFFISSENLSDMLYILTSAWILCKKF